MLEKIGRVVNGLKNITIANQKPKSEETLEKNERKHY